MWVYLLAVFVLYNVLRKLYGVAFRKSVKDDIILITGGASGLGRRMAIGFASLGAKLVLWDINEQGLAKVAAEAKKAGAKEVWTFKCDLSKRTNVYDVAKTVKEQCGPVDILVNNAGIVSGKSILSDDWNDDLAELTITVNTTAHFWTCRAFLPDMVKRKKGHLVTISSAAGLQGTCSLADYCASKFGAYGFNESIRREIAKANVSGVYTTVVCPFYINTGMFEGAKSSFPLLPILDEGYVAQQIIDAVRENNPMLGLPWLIHYSHILIAILPTTVSDLILTWLGVANSMDHFVGRRKTK